jgi:hypothetical protein
VSQNPPVPSGKSPLTGVPNYISVPPTIRWLETVQAKSAIFKSKAPKMVLDAAPASRTVPYFYGLDYGVGVDSPSGTALNVAATGTPSQIPLAGGDTLSYTMNEITSEEDLQTALGLSVEANGGIGLFSGSARMDYAKSCSIHSSSVFLIVRIQVTQAFTMIKQPGIDPAAAALLANGNVTRFQEQYGDMFVRGIQTGGQFFGVIQVDTHSESDQESVSASVSAAYGPFGASGSFSDQFKQALNGRNTKATCYIEGGQDSPLPFNVEMLMQAASNWPATVAGRSVPYYALLDGYNILPLPNPPNYIDLQHQQDVLRQCAFLRNQDLMTLNDIAYIKLNPNEFVGVDAHQLDQWQNNLSDDLNTIAAAASNALNNPKDAKVPDLKVPPPVVLPKRIAGAVMPVQVPDLSGMYMRDADDKLRSLGLKSATTVVVTTQYGSGDCFGQNPPADTPVQSGSTVTYNICRNPNDE